MNDLIDLLRRAAEAIEYPRLDNESDRFTIAEELKIAAIRLERVFDKEPEAEPVA